ncbi:hypothetical protein [Ancylobacter rudongensis]|uniref:Uncharacterized protein n=1 Tax=Ancylobacter rudongensis TaxID=177413 RepID=A0A1G4UP82_9HYPH|nr:hypothetical protein [Ancylobacter rudongensis]SCW95354.1 hypothetical protein SAMN05660859_0005 [Ancylobacter rudongensis]
MAFDKEPRTGFDGGAAIAAVCLLAIGAFFYSAADFGEREARYAEQQRQKEAICGRIGAEYVEQRKGMPLCVLADGQVFLFRSVKERFQ